MHIDSHEHVDAHDGHDGMLAQGPCVFIISAQSVALMACKAAWHKTLKRRSVLKKKKRLLKKRRHTHDPVSEESTWEPPSPNLLEEVMENPLERPSRPDLGVAKPPTGLFQQSS